MSERYLKVTVQPGRRVNSVETRGERFIVSTKAQAKDGAANDAVRVLLADHLRLPVASVMLLRGAKKTSKLFLVRERA